MKLIKEFKEFAVKGNMLDMAVGVIIGSAFGKIVTSLVNDIFMPVLSLLTGGIHFDNLFIALDGNTYATLEAATEAGASTLRYGAFITAIIDFLLIAISIFMVIKAINRVRRLREEPAPEPVPARKCPYCCTEIDEAATRCPHCTSQLDKPEQAS